MFLVSATSDYSSFEIHHNQISYNGSIHCTFDYGEEGARWTLAMQSLEIKLDLNFFVVWKIKFKYLKVGEMFMQVFDFFQSTSILMWWAF
jgi:hypothetical protein